MSKGNSNKFKLGYRTPKSFIGRTPFRLEESKMKGIGKKAKMKFAKKKIKS